MGVWAEAFFVSFLFLVSVTFSLRATLFHAYLLIGKLISPEKIPTFLASRSTYCLMLLQSLNVIQKIAKWVDYSCIRFSPHFLHPPLSLHVCFNLHFTCELIPRKETLYFDFQSMIPRCVIWNIEPRINMVWYRYGYDIWTDMVGIWWCLSGYGFVVLCFKKRKFFFCFKDKKKTK